MKLTSCYPSGADNLAGTPGFLKNYGPLINTTQFPTNLHWWHGWRFCHLWRHISVFPHFPYQEAGQTAEPVWARWCREKSLSHLECNSSTVAQQVAKSLYWLSYPGSCTPCSCSLNKDANLPCHRLDIHTGLPDGLSCCGRRWWHELPLYMSL